MPSTCNSLTGTKSADPFGLGSSGYVTYATVAECVPAVRCVGSEHAPAGKSGAHKQSADALGATPVSMREREPPAAAHMPPAAPPVNNFFSAYQPWPKRRELNLAEPCSLSTLSAMECSGAPPERASINKKAPGLMELLEASVELEADTAIITQLACKRTSNASVAAPWQTGRRTTPGLVPASPQSRQLGANLATGPQNQSKSISASPVTSERQWNAEAVSRLEPTTPAGVPALATPAGLKMAIDEGVVGCHSLEWMAAPSSESAMLSTPAGERSEGGSRADTVLSPGARRLHFTATSSL